MKYQVIINPYILHSYMWQWCILFPCYGSVLLSVQFDILPCKVWLSSILKCSTLLEINSDVSCTSSTAATMWQLRQVFAPPYLITATGRLFSLSWTCAWPSTSLRHASFYNATGTSKQLSPHPRCGAL